MMFVNYFDLMFTPSSSDPSAFLPLHSLNAHSAL